MSGESIASLALRPDQPEGAVLETERDLLRAHHRAGMLAERDGADARRDEAGELLAVRVVEVDHGDLGRRAGFAGEEPGLHAEVGSSVWW
jgi:hypothetical protein